MLSIPQPTSSVFCPWTDNLRAEELPILTIDSIKLTNTFGRDAAEIAKTLSQVLGTSNLLAISKGQNLEATLHEKFRRG